MKYSRTDIETGKMKHFDVGILGIWWGGNYGSVSTYYALFKVIRDFGLSILMIDAPRANIIQKKACRDTQHTEDFRRFIFGE